MSSSHRQPPPKKLFSSPNWQACYEAWLVAKEQKSGSQDTRTLYAGELRRFFAYCGKAPTQVTQADVLTYLHKPNASRSARCGQPPAANTMNVRLTVISSFYHFAARYTIVSRGRTARLFRGIDPTEDIDHIGRVASPNSLTESELIALFAAIPDTVRGKRDRALLLCYFWTCRRRAEILRLRWGDLEQSQGVWYYTYTRKGKSRQPKRRELPAPAARALLDYLEASGRRETIRPEDYLFISGYSTATRSRHLDAHNVYYMLHKYARHAGISPIKCHTLRHFGALARYDANEHDLEAIRDFLDHSSIATTQIYLLQTAKQDDPDAQKLYSRFGKL